MDKKIKTWSLRFPAKENPNMEKALLDWPIVLQYDVKAKYRLISRKFLDVKFFSPERSLNQPKAARVCIHSINQSNRSISVRLLFLFCSRVFISRSYENCSIWLSPLEIGVAQLRSVTEIAPPQFCVNRSPVCYDYRGGAKAIQYNVKIVLVSWSLIGDGLLSLVSPRPEVDGGWVSDKNKQTNKSRFCSHLFSIVLRNRK